MLIKQIFYRKIFLNFKHPRPCSRPLRSASLPTFICPISGRGSGWKTRVPKIIRIFKVTKFFISNTHALNV